MDPQSAARRLAGRRGLLLGAAALAYLSSGHLAADFAAPPGSR